MDLILIERYSLSHSEPGFTARDSDERDIRDTLAGVPQALATHYSSPSLNTFKEIFSVEFTHRLIAECRTSWTETLSGSSTTILGAPSFLWPQIYQ
jgi:hypothetical protein